MARGSKGKHHGFRKHEARAKKMPETDLGLDKKQFVNFSTPVFTRSSNISLFISWESRSKQTYDGRSHD
jgi:hypothetical protein